MPYIIRDVPRAP